MGATSSQRTSQVPGFSMIQHFVVVAIATSGSVRSSDLSCARGLITAEKAFAPQVVSAGQYADGSIGA